jgi:cell division protein FtsQ
VSLEFNHNPARSWRDIPQPVKPRAMSREGRRRLVLAVLRVTTVSSVLLGVGWGAWQVSRVVGDKTRSSAAAQGVPVAKIDFSTDGALDQAWILRALALPKNATLLDLDLGQLRARVLAHGQVIHATVERQFPATLAVRTTERSPVARVLGEAEGQPQVLLVARDGVVFPGVGFDAALLDTLPWLDGVTLVRTPTGFAPIAGMPTAAELLAKAKLEADHLYRAWHVVSLARLESDGEIDVQTKNDALRVRFATNQDFFRQLARLDWLIDTTQRKTGRAPAQIDLTNGAQVPVVLAAVDQGAGASARPAAFAPPAPAAGAKPFVIPAFPNFSSQTKNQREF